MDRTSLNVKQKRSINQINRYNNIISRGQKRVIGGEEVIVLKADNSGDDFISKRSWNIISKKKNSRYSRKN